MITSCGGAEESWFWAAQGDRVRIGAGSFSAALVRGLSAEGNYAADDNRDVEITLTELKRYLRSQHGESTVQTYPEESDFVLLRYDVAHMEKRRAAVVENLAFEDDVLNIYQPNVRFTYNVLRYARLLYRLVDQVEGRWDFAGASLTEDSSLPGSTPGLVSPGMKQRTLSLTEPQVGYALLQLVSVVNGETSLTASKLLCMPPERENPRLAVHVPERLRAGREMNIVIDHACPCELAVQIVDVEGKKVRRLCAREASRPQGLYPAGSSLCWNGRDSEGEQITGGPYRVQVLAWVGEDMYRASSGWFWID